MKKKIFYEEYMQRSRPKPPDSIYSNTVNKILEKASPSLFLYVAVLASDDFNHSESD